MSQGSTMALQLLPPAKKYHKKYSERCAHVRITELSSQKISSLSSHQLSSRVVLTHRGSAQMPGTTLSPPPHSSPSRDAPMPPDPRVRALSNRTHRRVLTLHVGFVLGWLWLACGCHLKHAIRLNGPLRGTHLLDGGLLCLLEQFVRDNGGGDTQSHTVPPRTRPNRK